MKISLINTPRSPYNAILDNAPPDALPFIHRKLIGPPLGLLTIAQAVNHHDVFLLETKGEYDLNPDAPPLAQMVREHLEDFQPDIVGVSVITSEFDYGMEILSTAKSVNPEILTVAGGLHATLCPEDFARGPADIVALGQSIESFRAIVRAAEGNSSFSHIRGLHLNTADGYVYTGSQTEPIDEARDFLMPNRDLLKRWIGTYKVGGSPHSSTYLFTSLGCPYKCSFCSIWPLYGGRFLKRDVESIIDELKTLEDYPVVRFSDANTLVDAAFLHRLFDRIAQENIQKFFIMDIRVDAAVEHPRLMEKMARGGLKVVISGFESFREDELRKYNKSSKAELIKQAIDVFHANEIMIRGNYVVPPEYDRDDFKALAEYAASHKVAYAGYTILTPMPGTKLWAELKDQVVDHDLKKYNFFNSVLKTKLPTQEFHERIGSLWSIKKGLDVI
jgi:hopanoid C-3 methylase